MANDENSHSKKLRGDGVMSRKTSNRQVGVLLE